MACAVQTFLIVLPFYGMATAVAKEILYLNVWWRSNQAVAAASDTS